MPRGKPLLGQHYQANDWIPVFLDVRVYCQLNNSKIWCFQKGLARGCVNLSFHRLSCGQYDTPDDRWTVPRREVQVDHRQ